MSLFFETLRVEEGKLFNLEGHTRRLHRTRYEIFGLDTPLDLAAFIGPVPTRGLYRCRVLYDRELRSVEFHSYRGRDLGSFRLVHSSIRYPHKAAHRREIDELFAGRGAADDILIVSPEGLLRDTSIANIALKLGGRWWTPSAPLLPGTMREKLLNEGFIEERELVVEDLKSAESFAVMNAMVGFSEIADPRFLYGSGR